MGKSTANGRFQRVVRAASAHGTYTKSVAVGAALFQKPLPGAQEWSTNLLGACADRASITMEGAVCAKQKHGPRHPTWVISSSHQRKSRSGTWRSSQKANGGHGKLVRMLN